MAKRKRRRPKTKRPKKVTPDEVVEFLGVTMARYGRVIDIQSHRTAQEQKELDAHWEAMYPQVVEDIDERVGRIRELVASFDPLELMCRGFWKMSESMIGKTAEGDYSFPDAIAARMVDYVQSIIVSTPPVPENTEVADKAWDDLYNEVEQLYHSLCLSYHIVNSARLKATQPDYDADYDGFCVQAQMHWAFVRVVRYAVHDSEFLRDFLGPHDEVCQRLFGISIFDFIDAIGGIHDSLSRDSMGAFQEMHEQHEKAIRLLEQKEKQDPDKADMVSVLTELSKDPGWEERRASIAGRIFGLDLFHLQRITRLPEKLLNELSFAPGEDDSFFAPGAYAGWPLRILPIKLRPFLRVDGKHYCFDQINIMDDIYRVMQRLICRLEPTYVNEWNDRQKEVSEKRPIELFQELLPGATSYRSITYPWKTGESHKTNWCELDGLIIFDDALFIIEVKAGAFTRLPPSTDFPTYVASIKDLLKKPAEQAARFLEYLRSQDTVLMFDAEHKRVGELSRHGFRNVIPVTLTLDALTTAAYQIEELRGVGITVPEPVCSMSIDDLRVYRDVFDSAVAFTHFMQKRYEAECNPKLHVNDELDHLGLYLTYLDYVAYASDMSRGLGGDIKYWDGYREVIDRYFFSLQIDPSQASKPMLPIGPHLSEILRCMDREKLPGRCKCAAYLLDLARPTRRDFEKSLADSLDRSRKRGQPSAFHVQGESNITVFCDGPGIASMPVQEKRDYTYAWMIRAPSSERLLLSVRFDAQENIKHIRWEFLRLEDVPTEDLERIRAMSQAQGRRRILKYVREHGELRRNDPCPCGSGKKYKRCCGGT